MWVCFEIKCFTFHILKLKFHMQILSLYYFTSISHACDEYFHFTAISHSCEICFSMLEIFHMWFTCFIISHHQFLLVNFTCFAFHIQFTWYFTCSCPVVLNYDTYSQLSSQNAKRKWERLQSKIKLFGQLVPGVASRRWQWLTQIW